MGGPWGPQGHPNLLKIQKNPAKSASGWGLWPCPQKNKKIIDFGVPPTPHFVAPVQAGAPFSLLQTDLQKIPNRPPKMIPEKLLLKRLRIL